MTKYTPDEMQIKMENEIVKLTAKQAIDMLPNEKRKRIHTFHNSAIGTMVGTDMDIKTVIETIKRGEAEQTLQLSGKVATAMGHKITCCDAMGRWLFIETRDDSLADESN